MIGAALVPFAATPLAAPTIFTFTNIATAFTIGSMG